MFQLLKNSKFFVAPNLFRGSDTIFDAGLAFLDIGRVAVEFDFDFFALAVSVNGEGHGVSGSFVFEGAVEIGL